MVGDDLNQWDISSVLQDFADMREADVGPTRKEKCLDEIFTNFSRSLTDFGSVPPLDNKPCTPGAASDHRVAFFRAKLPKVRAFEWMSYSYRRYSDNSAKLFGSWLAGYDWAPQVDLVGNIYLR